MGRAGAAACAVHQLAALDGVYQLAAIARGQRQDRRTELRNRGPRPPACRGAGHGPASRQPPGAGRFQVPQRIDCAQDLFLDPRLHAIGTDHAGQTARAFHPALALPQNRYGGSPHDGCRNLARRRRGTGQAAGAVPLVPQCAHRGRERRQTAEGDDRHRAVPPHGRLRSATRSRRRNGGREQQTCRQGASGKAAESKASTAKPSATKAAGTQAAQSAAPTRAARTKVAQATGGPQ